MRKVELFALLTSKKTPYVTIKGQTGILQSVQREDGSGNSFNLAIRREDGQLVHVHVWAKD